MKTVLRNLITLGRGGGGGLEIGDQAWGSTMSLFR